MEQHSLEIQTQGRATIEITAQVNNLIKQSGIQTGLCHVFIQHTSASLIITENADSNVRKDLEYFIHKLVVDGDPHYLHDQEGDDDMAAHIRSVLTLSDISIPVSDGKLLTGTWQGLYLWEHRYQPHRRHLIITLTGNK